MSELRRLNLLDHQQQEQNPFWDNSLAAQFRSSLTRIAKQQNWPLPFGSHDPIDAIMDEAEERADKPLDRSFLNIAIEALTAQFVRTTVQDIVSECSAICESPIELAMCFALGLVGPEHADGVQFCLQGRAHGQAERDLVLRITPQAQISSYRADFLLTMQLVDEGPEISIYKKHLIVECDGFDFHDRTPEQAAKDRQRDRELQTRGFNVFRYTGSEIWADVFRCAEQAVTFLTGSIEAQRVAAVLRRKPAERVGAGREAERAAL